MDGKRKHRRIRGTVRHAPLDARFKLFIFYTPDDEDFERRYCPVFCNIAVNGERVLTKVIVPKMTGSFCCYMGYRFEEKYRLRITFFGEEVSVPRQYQQKWLGEASCTVASLVMAEKGFLVQKLPEAEVTLGVRETTRSKQRCIVQFHSPKYPLHYKNSYTNPFLAIMKIIESKGKSYSNPSYDTEAVFDRKTKGRISWKPLFLSPFEIGCESSEIVIAMYHHRKNLVRRKPVCLASVTIDADTFLENHPETDPLYIPIFELPKGKAKYSSKECGMLETTIKFYDTFPGFMAFLQDGIEFRFIMGCDRREGNLVEKTCDRIWLDARKIFKVYDSEMRNMKSYQDQEDFMGVSFADGLAKVEEYAQKSVDEGKLKYYVFLWLTFDGLEENTKFDKIKQASRLPISVIIVGMGVKRKRRRFMRRFMEEDEEALSTFLDPDQRTFPRSILQCAHFKDLSDLKDHKYRYNARTKSQLYSQYLAYMFLNNVQITSDQWLGEYIDEDLVDKFFGSEEGTDKPRKPDATKEEIP